MNDKTEPTASKSLSYEGWINVSWCDLMSKPVVDGFYSTKGSATALRHSHKKHLACIRVRFQDGELRMVQDGEEKA